MAKATAAAAAKIDETPKPAPAGAQLGAADVKQILTETKLRVVPILQSEIWARDGGIKFNTHECVPPAGTTKEHIVEPTFWGNVSQKMRAGDTIIVFPRDGSFYAELLVWGAGQNWAQVSPKGGMERPEFAAMPGVDPEFTIRQDPIDGVCVVRIKTGERVKSNFPNSEDARRWMLDHQSALRR